LIGKREKLYEPDDVLNNRADYLNKLAINGDVLQFHKYLSLSERTNEKFIELRGVHHPGKYLLILF
jgi:hypothetical protein